MGKRNNRRLAAKIWTGLLTNPKERKNRLTASSINIIQDILDDEFKKIEKNRWLNAAQELNPKPKTNCGYKISDNLKF